MFNFLNISIKSPYYVFDLIVFLLSLITARNHISKMSKKKKAKPSDDPRVMDATKDLQKQCELYHQNPDGNQGEKLKASKEMLEKVYLDIADKELNEVIGDIVSSDNKQSKTRKRSVCT